ncbi:MAG: DNA protection during starvation protein [uncultured Truepera sp.]|uniref:DNA protection during starvation protein n=1 Tax=uncultured Truepera sp. TaxID=543023 RepID=A0A6J4V659_9DEIN|nr:MAG: DNA protection during starvation protein [uncultured Truepera sp.]
MATTTANVTTFETRIDIEADVRKELIDLLNQQLADATDLFTQTKQAHWNVKGLDFFQLHELFDTLAKIPRKQADLLAERATALGGMALGTVRMAAENSTLPEYPLQTVEGRDVVNLMVERWAAYAASTRAAIARSGELGEPTTEDLLTELSREIDESLYFLEAHLQGRQS